MSDVKNTTSSENENPYVVEEINGKLKLFSDGSIIRYLRSINPTPKLPLDDAKYPTISPFDFEYDPTHNLYLRVYRDEFRLYTPYVDGPFGNPTIIIYLHGGGFCLDSLIMAANHNFCIRLCNALAEFVISVDYRLAPDDRLPAAVDDVWTALKWVRETFCEGENRKGFGRVVIFGDSAGGNIAHNLAVRIASGGWRELDPIRVVGYVLLAPLFGGGATVQGLSRSYKVLETSHTNWRDN
ncbi:probable carboxylesterase 15 isoform X2 [Spinacia oleracea]|uniref:Probable carboxylesterase 15 isoform X2 n=1 Tax=Spinacia oleracea TaxID=3562 RepID=A0ABM3QGE7_SPIOL|nr:probable carboxylesterase 15 isoform X2 [Spinacia oleracea]